MRYESIFVPLKGFLGDNVLAAPTLDVLAAHTDRLIVETEPVVAALLASPERPFEHWQRARSWGEGSALVSRLRREQPSAACLVSRSIRSATLAWRAKIPIRVGHNTEFRGPLLTRSVDYDRTKYEAACYADLLPLLDLPLPDLRPRLHVDPAALEDLRKLGFECTVAVQPGASGENKKIPLENLRAVVDEAIQFGHRVAIVGGKDETEDANRLADLCAGRAEVWAGKFSIPQLKAALSTLKLCVGGDTGMMHVAAGVGCPTLTVFANLPASKWGHDYEPHVVLPSPDGIPSKLPAEELLGSVRKQLGRI